MATIRDRIAEDAVWHFPGRRGKLAGSHRGREAIFAFLIEVQTLTEGTFGIDLDRRRRERPARGGVLPWPWNAQWKDARQPDLPARRLVGGKVAEVWEFVWDLEHVEEFWA